ncbi:hypothetical protein GGR51DRAFT_504152 [Nemania sp. FL0031]|nr:hypothetical protein GGR51DRAFT_504152 [Nemania sp. FL0031]
MLRIGLRKISVLMAGGSVSACVDSKGSTILTERRKFYIWERPGLNNMYRFVATPPSSRHFIISKLIVFYILRSCTAPI